MSTSAPSAGSVAPSWSSDRCDALSISPPPAGVPGASRGRAGRPRLRLGRLRRRETCASQPTTAASTCSPPACACAAPAGSDGRCACRCRTSSASTTTRGASATCGGLLRLTGTLAATYARGTVSRRVGRCRSGTRNWTAERRGGAGHHHPPDAGDGRTRTATARSCGSGIARRTRRPNAPARRTCAAPRPAARHDQRGVALRHHRAGRGGRLRRRPGDLAGAPARPRALPQGRRALLRPAARPARAAGARVLVSVGGRVRARRVHVPRAAAAAAADVRAHPRVAPPRPDRRLDDARVADRRPEDRVRAVRAVRRARRAQPALVLEPYKADIPSLDEPCAAQPS